eukprot:gene3664-5226_t
MSSNMQIPTLPSAISKGTPHGHHQAPHRHRVVRARRSAGRNRPGGGVLAASARDGRAHGLPGGAGGRDARAGHHLGWRARVARCDVRRLNP